MRAITIILLGLSFIPTSCNDAIDDSIDLNSNPIITQLDALPSELPDDLEIAALLYMKEEEKLARDVYDFLFSQFSLRVFDNISSSEQNHMNTIDALISKYQLDDPSVEIPGEFVNSDLQALYNDLILSGSSGIEEALQVGAAIEEIDIMDLRRELDSNVDNQDIILVFENLMKGSRNHLRSFVKNLDNRNLTYYPQFLSQEEYNAIINSSM